MPFFPTIIVVALAGILAVNTMGFKSTWPMMIAVGLLGAGLGGALARFLASFFAAAGGGIAVIIGIVLGALIGVWLYKTYIGDRWK